MLFSTTFRQVGFFDLLILAELTSNPSCIWCLELGSVVPLLWVADRFLHTTSYIGWTFQGVSINNCQVWTIRALTAYRA